MYSLLARWRLRGSLWFRSRYHALGCSARWIYLAVVGITVAVCVLLWFYPFKHISLLKLFLNKVGTLPSILEDYCNRNDYGGLEGVWQPPCSDFCPQYSSSYLVAVIVLTRHGDRAPLRVIPPPYHLHACARVQLSYAGGLTGQRQWMLYRHFMERRGRRLNVHRWLKSLPVVPRTSVICPPAELTPTGAVQMLRLGQYLKKRYLKISPITNEADVGMINTRKINIKQVITTPFARTYQSALALMHGLVPNLAPSDYRLGAVSDLVFCNHSESCYCPHHRSYDDNQNASPKFLNLANFLNLHYDHMMPGFPKHAFHIADALMGYSCYSQGLPCGSFDLLPPNQQRCPTNEDVAECLQESVNQMNGLLRNDLEMQRYEILQAWPLLERIGKIFEDLMMDKEKLKKDDALQFHYFSGHDLTLLPLLHVLGQRATSVPSLAGRVVFEVWFNPASKPGEMGIDGNSLFLRLLYNGADITNAVPCCAKTSKLEKVCKLQSYVSYLKNNLFTDDNIISVKDECTALQNNFSKSALIK